MHPIRFDQKCNMEDTICCPPEGVNDIIEKVVHNPLHVLSILLMFIVLLGFPIHFYIQ